MALRPTETNEEQRLRSQLLRDRASLETKKGSRSIALNISTDPKESQARRAEFAARYKKLVKEIDDLESKIASTTREVTRAKSRQSLERYDEAEGLQQLEGIKAKYALLAEAYRLDEDPEIKAKIDTLVQDYKDISTSVIGRPLSLAAARTALAEVAPTFASPTSGIAPAPATASTPTATPSAISGTSPKPKAKSSTGLEVQAGPGYKPSGKTGGKTTSTVEKPGGPVVKGYDALLAEVQADYSLPDIIFSNVPSLGKILNKYVNEEINLNQFKKEIEKDPWYRQNSSEIKTRYLQKFNYQDLVNSGNAKGTTDYEQQIAKITNNLIKKSREIGSVIDEGQAKLIAEDLYIHNQDADDAVVTRRLVSGIRPMAGMIGGKLTEDYSGLALQNYQGLQAIAKRNGFRIEDILPRGVDGKPATAQETLQRLALGEIDPTRLEQDVRKLAAIGQPQFVRDLLGQGIDLEEIYSPYRKTMATILELDEGQIDLTDPTLRMGINDKGDVNLYDYSKALRQDSRWQYTGNARQEVSDAALTVLRNFGFQG